MDTFLKVTGVSKAYPGEALGAVNGISFSINEGEIQSFVGESGSGKSTLLRMLAGLLRPDAGQITLRDEPLENPEEQLIAGHPSIRMVFQDFDLMPNMTVAENLRYPLLAYDKGYSQQRVQELLALCRIDGLAHKLPRELSGGQQQRVALARALADEPELLLMDEPFSQLDPVNKGQLIQEVLRILKAEGVALVLVTHDTRDALMISDRVGFLESGKLIQNEAPGVLYHQPLDLTVASFFGHVNVFDLEEVREFSTEIAKLMQINGAVKAGVRSENVALTTNKEGCIEAQVEQCFFQGDRYFIRARRSNGLLLGFFESEPLSPQITIFVSFDAHQILFFSG